MVPVCECRSLGSEGREYAQALGLLVFGVALALALGWLTLKLFWAVTESG